MNGFTSKVAYALISVSNGVGQKWHLYEELKQKPQPASFVLRAHMVMFNSFPVYRRVKGLFVSRGRVLNVRAH